jgi:membrane protein required for colicin V production
MNVIDIIILICFIPALVYGIKRGFIRQAVSILAVLLGAWMSFKFSSLVASWLKPYMDASGTVLQVIAFIIIFIVVIILLELLGKALTGLIKLVLLGWADKLLGVVFAFVKVFLVVGLAVLLFDTLNSKFELVKPETIEGSIFYGPIKNAADVVFPYIKQMIFNN